MTLKKYILPLTLFALVFTAILFPELSQAQETLTPETQVPQIDGPPVIQVPMPRCGPRPVMVKHLTDNYSESQSFLGIVQPGVAVEIFVNKETQTWTVLMSRIDGVSCAMAGGEGVKFFDDTTSDE